MNYLRLSWRRSIFELRLFVRNISALMFSGLFPVFLLLIFGSILKNQSLGPHTNVKFAQYLMAGLLASGMLYSALQQLAISVPEERVDGTLKRLYGTPMPKSVYFVGKFACALCTYIFQAFFLLLIGHLFYGVHIPPLGVHWVEFAWLSVLGLVACTLLGLCLSTVARDSQSASAIAAPLVVFFQFTSGVFFVYANLPKWMQTLAAIFPLKWIAQAMRGVFLPAAFAQREVGHTFAFGEAAIVLSAWMVGALIVAVRTFRWLPRGTD